MGSNDTKPEPAAPSTAKTADTRSADEQGYFTQEPGQGPDAPEDRDAPERADPKAIAWTASEFIAHAKSPGWYVALAAAAAVLAAIVYLISRDIVSVIVVVVAAMLLGFYGGRQPRQLEYKLDYKGLSIGDKHLGYGEFRSFSVMAEAGFSSIVFMPLKRFAAPTTIYYPPEDEDKIVAVLSGHLPLEERTHDAVDRLMHRIRY
jgi:hypothetical protein